MFLFNFPSKKKMSPGLFYIILGRAYKIAICNVLGNLRKQIKFEY